MQSQRFIFRAAKDAEELYQLLKLRYEIYRDSRLAGFVRDNKYGVDIDAYDFRAVHFGLFEQQGRAEVPVGYMRVIGKSFDSSAHYLDILRSISEISEQEAEYLHTLPFCNYFPETTSIDSFVGKEWCEAGRFAVKSAYRCLHLSKFMCEGAIAYALFYKGLSNAAVFCKESHLLFYKRYGFTQLGTPKFLKPPFSDSVTSERYALLTISRDSMPSFQVAKFKNMVNEYCQLGRLGRDHGKPQWLSGTNYAQANLPIINFKPNI